MAFSLANNHSMDFGSLSLLQSIREIQSKGGMVSGFGGNTRTAREPVFFDHESIRWAWLSACEPQFGISTEKSAGLAATGPWMLPAIEAAASKSDFVIVSVHGGNEDLPWPAPETVHFYHALSHAGASVIHGHHSHVPQGVERYGDSSIFYGMGNFAVNPLNWQSTPNALWSITARFDPTFPNLWRIEPVVIKESTFQERGVIQVNYSQSDQLAKAMLYLDLVSAPIVDPDLLEGIWQESAIHLYFAYGARFMEWDIPFVTDVKQKSRRIAASLAKNLWFTNHRTSKLNSERTLMRYHMIVNDSHRNMLKTALGVLGGEIEDQRSTRSKQLFDSYLGS